MIPLKTKIKRTKSCLNTKKLNSSFNFQNEESNYDDTTDIECLSFNGDSSVSINNQFPKDENEDILINLSKRQRKLSNYSEDSNGIAFSSRDSILNWVENVLNSVDLNNNEKDSIFHRFSTCFDLVMDKLYIEKNSIQNEDELKKMTITIFLVTYKFEGFTIGKVSISNLIEAFLSSLNINKEELENTILENELKILNLLDYNPFCLENNIYEVSLILIDLLKKKFCISQNLSDLISAYLRESNKNVLISNKILFETVSLDKAAISIIAVIIFLKKILIGSKINSINNNFLIVEVENLDKNFYNYLKFELKVLRSGNWTEFKLICMYFEDLLEKTYCE
jgi:hypothetical protein